MKILLIIIFVYILLRLTGRYVFPYLLRYYLKRFSKKFYEGENNFNRHNAYNQKEGEMKVDNAFEKNTNHSSDVGEYVDYEDIN